MALSPRGEGLALVAAAALASSVVTGCGPFGPQAHLKSTSSSGGMCAPVGGGGAGVAVIGAQHLVNDGEAPAEIVDVQIDSKGGARVTDWFVVPDDDWNLGAGHSDMEGGIPDRPATAGSVVDPGSERQLVIFLERVDDSSMEPLPAHVSYEGPGHKSMTTSMRYMAGQDMDSCHRYPGSF